MKTEIILVNEQVIRNKIYEIRGQKVMLDFDLAEIYGYTTKSFNQQVKRNADRFDDDFIFQLTRKETEEISRSQNVTSIQVAGIKGGRSSLPYAFTESGIYMLMTVLKGDLAVQQSKALIRTFRAMKNFIVENRPLIGQHDYLRLSMQVSDTQQTVHAIQSQLVKHEAKFNEVFVHLRDYNDSHREFPEITVSFQITDGIMHDRFIILDYNTEDEKMYHCGASSKDAGVNRITVISELSDAGVKAAFHDVVN